MIQSTIGVDISKDTLDVHRHPAGDHRQFSNDTTGFKALIKWLGKDAVCRIVFEATGAYHRAFEQALDKAGLPLCKVNPRNARRFGEAIGQLTKTDRVDAAMLAQLGVMIKPPIRPAPRQALCDLKQLHVARKALIKDRTAAKNRQKNLCLSILKRQINQRLQQIETQLSEIETAMQERIKGDTELARRFAILLSIPGVAERSAFAILIDMPELGSLDCQTAASLSGTAPRIKQSGKRKGRAFVHGGRPYVRNMLFMPALVAARFNPDMKAKYQKLITAGKPSKVALTAIMRKLIILANALIRDDRLWNEKAA